MLSGVWVAKRALSVAVARMGVHAWPVMRRARRHFSKGPEGESSERVPSTPPFAYEYDPTEPIVAEKMYFTLERALPSPAPEHTFHEPPVVKEVVEYEESDPEYAASRFSVAPISMNLLRVVVGDFVYFLREPDEGEETLFRFYGWKPESEMTRDERASKDIISSFHHSKEAFLARVPKTPHEEDMMRRLGWHGGRKWVHMKQQHLLGKEESEAVRSISGQEGSSGATETTKVPSETGRKLPPEFNIMFGMKGEGYALSFTEWHILLDAIAAEEKDPTCNAIAEALLQFNAARKAWTETGTHDVNEVVRAQLVDRLLSKHPMEVSHAQEIVETLMPPGKDVYSSFMNSLLRARQLRFRNRKEATDILREALENYAMKLPHYCRLSSEDVKRALYWLDWGTVSGPTIAIAQLDRIFRRRFANREDWFTHVITEVAHREQVDPSALASDLWQASCVLQAHQHEVVPRKDVVAVPPRVRELGSLLHLVDALPMVDTLFHENDADLVRAIAKEWRYEGVIRDALHVLEEDYEDDEIAVTRLKIEREAIQTLVQKGILEEGTKFKAVNAPTDETKRIEGEGEVRGGKPTKRIKKKTAS